MPKTSPAQNSPLGDVRLMMRGIEKKFGATTALADVSLSARGGETLALIGENGAGKSTLMKILSGAHPPDSGSMLLDGQAYRPSGPHDARKAGIAMVYQELNLAPDLSVEDNIMLGQEKHRAGWLRRSQQRAKVREVMSLLGHAELDLRRSVGSLPIGTQQIVEIARGLISEAKVMVFDEPTSSLSRRDVAELFSLIRKLEERGLAIIYISHFLEEIREIAKRYVVLRDGRCEGDGLLAEVTDDRIVSLMVGRSVENLFPHVPHAIGEPVVSVRGLSGNRVPVDVSFELRRGEILGLFGLIGAGRTELLRLLMGLDKHAAGEVIFASGSASWSPQSRLQSGWAMVSEDRKGEGLAQSLSIAANLTLSDLQPYSRAGLLSLDKENKSVADWMARMEVKAQGPSQPIRQLSGGNQQKVAIGRALHQGADVLLFDEPTRGIDVGTKAAIYRLIGELAAAGKSILFVSSYLPELMATCDTIGVMSRGRLREVRPREDWTENDILSLAISAAQTSDEELV